MQVPTTSFAIIAPVKRLFIIFLLAVLPFQLTWAGMGTYCQHEEGRAAQHFGHHEHKHTVHGDQGKSDSGKVNAGTDNDCTSHLNSVKCFLSSQATPVLPQASVKVDLRLATYTSHIPDGPERPDRTLAA